MQSVGIAVMSLDGCLTKHETEGTAFASEADGRFFHQVLRTFDCTIMGSTGYRAARDAIHATLTEQRLRVVLTRTPDRYANDARPGILEFRVGGPIEVLRELAAQGYSRCAVVGGARVLGACLRARVLDELWITLEPVVFGNGDRLVEGAVDVPLELLTTELLGPNTLLLRYRPT